MNESNALLPLLITLLVGGIIGFVIYHLTLGKSKTTKQQKELDKNKVELEKYKAQVNDHFNGSAELMGQVASSYQALYDHMASQSQSLLSDAETTHFPLLKTSDKTDEEIEVTETEVKPDESEPTVVETQPEETEIVETEVKTEDVETTDTDLEPEDVKIADTDIKKEEAEITDTDIKKEDVETTDTDIKKEKKK